MRFEEEFESDRYNTDDTRLTFFGGIRLISSIIFGLILVGAFIMVPHDYTLRCDVPAKRCEKIGVNLLKMKQTDFLINPYDVMDVKVVEYQIRVRRHKHYRTETRYKVCFVDKDGSNVAIFSGYSNYFTAKNTADKIRNKFKAGGEIIEIND